MANIDHLAVAVNSLDEAVPLWTALLGEKPSGLEEVSGEEVRVALFGEGAGRIELLEPLNEGSPVGRFLDRQGPGLHHVCLRVQRLEEALRRAEEAGAEVLEPRVREGAEGRRVAFLHPGSAGGVLVELSEAPSGGGPAG